MFLIFLIITFIYCDSEISEYLIDDSVITGYLMTSVAFIKQQPTSTLYVDGYVI